MTFCEAKKRIVTIIINPSLFSLPFFFSLTLSIYKAQGRKRPLVSLLVNKQSSCNSFAKMVWKSVLWKALSPFLPRLPLLQPDRLIAEANENIPVFFRLRAFVWHLSGWPSGCGVSSHAVGWERRQPSRTAQPSLSCESSTDADEQVAR